MYDYECLIDDIGNWLDRHEDLWEIGENKIIILSGSDEVPSLVRECVNYYNQNR